MPPAEYERLERPRTVKEIVWQCVSCYVTNVCFFGLSHHDHIVQRDMLSYRSSRGPTLTVRSSASVLLWATHNARAFTSTLIILICLVRVHSPTISTQLPTMTTSAKAIVVARQQSNVHFRTRLTRCCMTSNTSHGMRWKRLCRLPLLVAISRMSLASSPTQRLSSLFAARVSLGKLSQALTTGLSFVIRSSITAAALQNILVVLRLRILHGHIQCIRSAAIVQSTPRSRTG